MITTLSNFNNIQLENDISVITLDDGINHTYCSKITWDQDNWMPIGSAKLIMPYSLDIEKYWIKYSGAVVIHANLNSMPQPKINETVHLDKDGQPKVSLNLRHFKEKQQEQEKVEVKETENKKHKLAKINNDEYNYSFIGKVYRFKQVGKTFIIYLEDLGWKFMQKVPKEFRDSFIANQPLDDAFQAICEFMGIEFAYSIEDLHEYTFSADGYSVEKDGQVIEDVPSILKEWANGTEEEEEEEETEDESMANALDSSVTPELGELKKHKKNSAKAKADKKKTQTNTSKNNKASNNVSNKAINALSTNQQENNDESTTEDSEEDKNNTDDINKKIEDFQEEFDEKIKDLFIGNRFYTSNIADPIMNYDWVTIEPKAPANDTSSIGGATGGVGGDNTNNSNNTNGGNNFDNASARSSLQSRDRNGWYGGQLYQNGKIVLYASYINSLPPQQAKAKSQQTGTYTHDTINKLKIRAQGVRVR